MLRKSDALLQRQFGFGVIQQCRQPAVAGAVCQHHLAHHRRTGGCPADHTLALVHQPAHRHQRGPIGPGVHQRGGNAGLIAPGKPHRTQPINQGHRGRAVGTGRVSLSQRQFNHLLRLGPVQQQRCAAVGHRFIRNPAGSRRDANLSPCRKVNKSAPNQFVITLSSASRDNERPISRPCRHPGRHGPRVVRTTGDRGNQTQHGKQRQSHHGGTVWSKLSPSHCISARFSYYSLLSKLRYASPWQSSPQTRLTFYSGWWMP